MDRIRLLILSIMIIVLISIVGPYTTGLFPDPVYVLDILTPNQSYPVTIDSEDNISIYFNFTEDGNETYYDVWNVTNISVGSDVCEVQYKGNDDLDYWGVLPNTLNYGTAVTINNTAYVIGGTNGTVSTDIVRYDPVTNTSTQMYPLPRQTYGAMAVVYGDKAYIFGGFNGTAPSGLWGDILEFDPVANTTTYINMLPKNFSYGCAGLYMDSVFLLGGYNGTGNVGNWIYEYNITSNTTQLYNELPNAFRHNGIHCPNINGKLYMMFGWSADISKYRTTVYAFDPVANTTTLAYNFSEWSIGRGNGATSYANGKLYYFWGSQGTGDFEYDEVIMYDPITNTTDTVNTEDFGLLYSAPTNVDNKIYLFGGRYDSSYTNNITQFSPNTTAEWTNSSYGWETRCTAPAGLTGYQDLFVEANYTNSSNFSYTGLKSDTENSAIKFRYPIYKIRLWLDGTENNKNYFQNDIANFTASLNLSSQTIYMDSNYTGFDQISNSTSVIYNITNLSTVGYNFNLSSWWSGDNNYSDHMQTYYFDVYSTTLLDTWDQENDPYSNQPDEGKPVPPAGYLQQIVHRGNNTHFWANYSNSSGNLILGYPVSNLTLEINNSWQTFADGETVVGSGLQVFDIDNDSFDEIIASGYANTGTEMNGRYGEITIWNVTNDQFYLEANTTWRTSDHGTASYGGTQIYDIDNDDVYEIISIGYYNNSTAAFGEITIWNLTGNTLMMETSTSWNNFDQNGTFGLGISIGDIDNDTVTELIITGVADCSIAPLTGFDGHSEITIWNITNGNLMMEANTSWDTLGSHQASTRRNRIADVDDDTYLEIITGGYTGDGTDWSEVTVWNVSGGTINLQANTTWQTWSGQDTGLYSTEVGDLDNDGILEIVVGGFARQAGTGNSWTEWTVFNYTSDTLMREANITWRCCNVYGGNVVSISIVDIDDDGTNEIISTGHETTAVLENTAIFIIMNKSGDTLNIEDNESWRYHDANRTYNNRHVIADIDRDGTLEIINGGDFEIGVGGYSDNFTAVLRIYNYSVPICKMYSNDTQRYYKMNLNQTNNLYDLNRSFRSCGFQTWNISCNRSYYSPLYQVSNITIHCPPPPPSSPSEEVGQPLPEDVEKYTKKEEQALIGISMPSNLTIYVNETDSVLLNLTRTGYPTCCVHVSLSGIPMDWLLTNLGAFSIGEDEIKSVNLTFNPDEPGEYSLDVIVTTPDFNGTLPFKLIVLEEGIELEPKCKTPWWLVIPIELEYPECYIPTWLIVVVGVLYWGYKHQRKYKQPPKKPSFWKRFKRKHKKIKIKETRRRPRRKSKKSKKKKYSWKISKRKPKKGLSRLSKKERLRIIEQRLRERA